MPADWFYTTPRRSPRIAAAHLIDRSKSIVADEGIPVLLGLAGVAGLVWYFGGFGRALFALVPLAFACLLFRDPRRRVATAPLGVVSPVDGKILETEATEAGVLNVHAQRIVIRVNPFGTYTARAPVEGKVMDLHCDIEGGAQPRAADGLWLKTDEGDDVVLRFRGHRFGLVPAAIVGYGSRIGQGQRCARLRWTRYADLEVPESARVTVSAGQRVTAGSDVLAELAAP